MAEPGGHTSCYTINCKLNCSTGENNCVHLLMYIVYTSMHCLPTQETWTVVSGKNFWISHQHHITNVHDVDATAVSRQALDHHPACRRHLLRTGLKAQSAAYNRHIGLGRAEVSWCQVERQRCKDRYKHRAVTCIDCRSLPVWFLEA